MKKNKQTRRETVGQHPVHQHTRHKHHRRKKDKGTERIFEVIMTQNPQIC